MEANLFCKYFIIYTSVYALYRLDINSKLKLKKKIQFSFVILCLIFVVYKMVIYHPYQNIYFNSLFNKSAHEKFEVDYWGLSGKKFLENILVLEKNKSSIAIGIASYLPLERSIKLLNKNEGEKIKIVGQTFQKADYIYSNFISEVDKNFNDKYKIPSNFTRIDTFIIDGIPVYEVYKKNK